MSLGKPIILEPQESTKLKEEEAVDQAENKGYDVPGQEGVKRAR